MFISALALSLVSVSPSADVIVLRHTRPARDVRARSRSTCGPSTFDVSYEASSTKTEGAIEVVHGDKLFTLADANPLIFSKLGSIVDISVSCGDDTLPSRILISGVDRESGVRSTIYSIGFLPSSGFSDVSEISASG